MDGSSGPQASTRNIKERRPTFHTQAGRSVAALEQRIFNLEGQPSSTSFKATAATDLDTSLNKFGQTFNGLEERVTVLEDDVQSNTDLAARLQTLEERLKPYEEYRNQALAAVKQLSDLGAELDASRRSANTPQKDFTALSDQVARQAADIRTLQKRWEQAHDEERRTSINSHASESTSTRNCGALIKHTTSALGEELVHRLKRGEILNASIVHELRSALQASMVGTDPTASTVRMQQTPVTDESVTSAHDSVEDKDERPSKRSRLSRTLGSGSKNELKKRDGRSRSPITPQQRSSARRSSKRPTTRHEDEQDDVNMEDMEDVEIPPELRRSGRGPRPNTLPEGHLLWTDRKVKKHMENID